MIMKKVVYFVVFAITSVLVSCDKNSSKNSTIENSYLPQNEETYEQENKRSNRNSFEFRTEMDVIAYLGLKQFYNGRDYIQVSSDGIYLNGQSLSFAPIVQNFSRNRAYITANTPTNGRLRIVVDTNEGTITDQNSGDVYSLK